MNAEQTLPRTGVPDFFTSLAMPRRNNLLGFSWRQPRWPVRSPRRCIKPLTPGDAAKGHAMLRGHFTLAGETVTSAPAALFGAIPRSSAWHDELVSLAWLQHLAAAPQQLAALTARSLIWSWQRQAMPRLNSRQAAHALIAIVMYAEFLLANADHDTHEQLAAIIDSLVRHMQRGFIESAETALLKSVALSLAAVTFEFPKTTRELALSQIARSIDKVVLPDGGHISRSPCRLLQLSQNLIPLYRLLRLSHVAVPAALNAAIERLLPMLRLLTHGDGNLTAFQDGCLADRAALQAVLAADASCGRPLTLAPHSGFGRLSYQDGTLIMDAGLGGPSQSPLAFEFSDASQRLIVSCGKPSSAAHPWRNALASPAAHSTCDLGEALFSLAPSVKAETISSPQGGLLQGQLQAHGWRRRATHLRRLFLAASGADLRGEDHVHLAGISGDQCCLRFHLHPLLIVEPATPPNCVTLSSPNGGSWLFSQAGGVITVDDSVHCEGGGTPQPARQIVVRSRRTDGLDVRWSLRRLSK